MGIMRYCKNDWVQTIVSRKNGEPLCIYAPPKLHQDEHPLNTPQSPTASLFLSSVGRGKASHDI